MPVENLLGEIGKGHKIAFNILNIGRLKLCAAAIGGARSRLAGTVEYAKTREQFKQPISNFGAIKHKLENGYPGFCRRIGIVPHGQMDR